MNSWVSNSNSNYSSLIAHLQGNLLRSARSPTSVKTLDVIRIEMMVNRRGLC